MSFPGMPGGAGSGSGGATAGMNDQEAAMVKAVSQKCMTQSRDTAKSISIVDARSHGELPFQDCYFGRNGIRSWRSFWVVHVKRTQYPS